MNQTQMDIAKTKAVLIERGWTRWAYQDGRGCVCLSEAIILAVNGRSDNLRGFRSDFLAAMGIYFQMALAQRAHDVVRAIVGAKHANGCGYTPVVDLFDLNDNEISSQGEALALLDEAMTTARAD